MEEKNIKVSDSSESVTEKKISKEQVENAIDFWMELVDRYSKSGYNLEVTHTENGLTVIVKFTKPEEETIIAELEAFDD